MDAFTPLNERLQMRIVATALCFFVALSAAMGASMFVEVEQACADASLTASSLWTLSKTSITLKNNSYAYVYLNGYTGLQPTVQVDKPAVASAYVYYDSSKGKYRVSIYKEGEGTAKVKVTSGDGWTNRTVTVKAKRADFKLFASTYVFSSKNYGTYYYPSSKYSGLSIKRIKSSNGSVVSAKMEKSGSYSWPKLMAKKAGKAKIVCTDQYGRKASMTVKVTKDYFKANLKKSSSAYSYYGDGKLTVYTRPGAVATMKIGSEKAKKKVDSDGRAVFYLNGTYRLGTSFKVALQTSKAKVSISNTVSSNTYAYRAGTIWSCKTAFPVRITNVHKGDVISLRLGCRVYTYTMQYSSASHIHTFYSAYRLGSYTSATITVKNKFGQTLCTKYDSWCWR